MIYRNSDPLVKAQFLYRANKFAEKGATVEMVEKRPMTEEERRTLSQNKIVWYWFNVFADATGCTPKEAHDNVLNAILGERWEYNPITRGKRPAEWHTSEMSKAQLSRFMDMFKAWAGEEPFNVYLPYYGDAGYDEMIEKYGRR